MRKRLTYKDSGVDNEAKEDVSRILYEAARRTWSNRKGRLGEVIVPFDDFSGIRYVDVSRLPKGTVMVGGADGIGTKVEIAKMIKDHRTVAFDLVAMCAEDIETRGAEPVLFFSLLDTNSLKRRKKETRQLAEGYENAAREANLAVLTGESAELGDLVGGFGPFNYNWGGVCIGFARKNRLLTGRKIKEGDFLVGLREEGFRSNGFSLVRSSCGRLGKHWYQTLWKNGKTIGELALIPSKIYTKAVVEMFGGYDKEPRAEVHGIAHITGGGIPEKLGRVLRPSRLGAYLDNPFEPSEFMSYVQVLGAVTDREAYKTWNMGQGMIIIAPKPEEVIGVASAYGIQAQKIGKVTREQRIRIKNRGAFCPDKNPVGGIFPRGEKVLSF